MDIEIMIELSECGRELYMLNDENLIERIRENNQLQNYLSDSVDVIDEAIARQSETEMAVCPDCNGSGVYQEYDEFDRYHVYACYKCEGTGEIARQSATSDIGETSDGYHTFNELYEHRTALFATLCNMRSDISWKSMKHDDGTMYDGMFIAGIETPDGQYTYHCEMKFWYMFAMTKEIEKAPAYDGHKPRDYSRLLSLSENSLYRQSVKSEDVAEAIEQFKSEYVDDFEGYPETCEKWNRNIDLAITALQAYEPKGE